MSDELEDELELESNYHDTVADLGRSHNNWRGMMRLALWASVLAMLFARLNDSTTALIIATIGAAVGAFCFVKVWLARREMKRLHDQQVDSAPEVQDSG